jgi:hypothetical protein
MDTPAPWTLLPNSADARAASNQPYPSHRRTAPRHSGRFQPRHWLRRWLILLGVSGIVSCTTTDENAKQFAAVTLRDHEPPAIRRTVEAVFTEKGYWDSSRRNLWCYERGTSKMGQLLYGGWFDEEGVRERVKLRLIPLSEGVYRLEAEAVMVRDAGDSFFEEETRMTRLKSGPYRKLLEAVEARLQQP